ncbi:ankyrin repeat and SOCS box protein 17 [Caerostris extrusa]|uniref:Ankyrin repeat and SOCS box protein 17 n=1 Tax=Caerostris extrusa TaxID=172846 RepID=A0AAV4XVZ5_CAEEX|nr:ankyrin repeat and SOCS box protein 17 [Caerostris extrusa]
MAIPFETTFLDFLVSVNCSLWNSRFFDCFKDSLVNEYLGHLDKILRTSRKTAHEVQTILEKFLKVFSVLKPEPELSCENLLQYEFMAELLKFCYRVNVENSQLITDLVKLVIDRSVVEFSFIRHVLQPHYPEGFYKYILKHVTHEKFDIVSYCSNHPRTLWEYSKNFSVVHVASFGNFERLLCLLQYGFEVFPCSEIKKSGHGHPFLNEVISQTHLMILQLMSGMRFVNWFSLDHTLLLDQGLCAVTKRQKDCIELIWRAIPQPFITKAMLDLDISTEYFYLALHGIFKPFRHNRNLKLAVMYEACFTDMAVGPHEPRPLKHLARCSIRKRLLKHGTYPKEFVSRYSTPIRKIFEFGN